MNKNGRRHMETILAQRIVARLDGARYDAEELLRNETYPIPSNIWAAIHHMASAMQWLTSLPIFIEYHQEYYRERYPQPEYNTTHRIPEEGTESSQHAENE